MILISFFQIVSPLWHNFFFFELHDSSEKEDGTETTAISQIWKLGHRNLNALEKITYLFDDRASSGMKVGQMSTSPILLLIHKWNTSAL